MPMKNPTPPDNGIACLLKIHQHVNSDTPLIAEIHAGNFNFAVLMSKQPVIVAFLAAWSQPCRHIEPLLNQIASDFSGKLKVVKVNADDNPEFSLWYEIQFVPPLLYFVDGSVTAKIIGAASKEAILSKFEHYPSPEEIRRRAHEIFLARGGGPGRQLDDWLAAEAELKGESNANV